jgi:hypothetical protein
VAYTFATVLPLIVPKSAEPTTAVFAGPPRIHPVARTARSIRNDPTPACMRTAPKRT